MFTGIIEQLGRIVETRPVSGGRRLRVDVGPMAGDCKIGASICVSGVCLTVVRVNGNCLEFDVIQETLNRTSFGSRRAGDSVNIEPSLRIGDRIDGHFVQGHVDGTAEVASVRSSAKELVIWFEPQTHLIPFVIPKGSIAIDGVSLTIAEVKDGRFSVALIPMTLEKTTFHTLREGAVVNIESDIIVRTIVHRAEQIKIPSAFNEELLRKAGYA